MGKLQEEFNKRKWHHDFDMGGEGYSIMIEDLEKIVDEIIKELPRLYPWEEEGFDINTMIEYYPIPTTDRERKLIECIKKWLI